MKQEIDLSNAPFLQPRFRVVCGKEVAFGPGKADLLELIKETGSINQAAKRMGMSYMRAWSLVQTMNRCFKQPVIDTARGGREHGGAVLTETGRQILALYRQLETKASAATRTTAKAILSQVQA